MPASVLSTLKKSAVICLLTLTGIINFGFVTTLDEQEVLAWSNKCFAQSYDASEEKLKKYEFTLTNDAFIRLRKTFTNGKQEYFSFHVKRLNDIGYLGTATTGTLQFKTTDDDIIVQTYNDRKGNVDSMANMLNIPVKNMAAERLDSLRNALEYFKNKGL